MNWLLPLLLAANVADPLSTEVALRRPNTYEANPLLVDPVARWVLKGTSAAVEVVAVRRLWRSDHRRAAVVLTFCVVAGNGLLAAHNLRQGR